MSTTQPIRNKDKVRELADYYYRQSEFRNYLLIIMGVHTALRISDLLKIKWKDVYDFERRRFRECVDVTEKKTGKGKLIKLNKALLAALDIYLPFAKQEDYLFKSRKGGAISRVQAYRIIRNAAEALDFHSRVSCHSLRKTFGYHAWKNGVSPAVLMEIYNHSSFAVTRRYLGVTQDDKDDVYSKVGDVF